MELRKRERQRHNAAETCFKLLNLHLPGATLTQDILYACQDSIRVPPEYVRSSGVSSSQLSRHNSFCVFMKHSPRSDIANRDG